MSIDLLELRELLKKECARNCVTCSGCKFKNFRLSICSIKNISDDEVKKLEKIVRESTVCTQSMRMSKIEAEIDLIFKILDAFNRRRCQHEH